MTVLVGVLCQDGVVIGSDSSMTFSAGPQFKTVEQPAQKTFVVGPDVILASTGSVGFAQRFHAVLANMRKSHKEWGNLSSYIETAKLISRRMLEDLSHTGCKPGGLGALVAYPAREGSFHLCEFGVMDFQPEFKVPSAWFVSMGSGQPIADPFLGLLRRTLFKNQQPRLEEGILATTWVLMHAIELNTGGINGPPQIGVLRREKGGSQFSARMLTDDELAEQRENVDAVETHLASYRDRLSKSTPPTIPLPEPPSDAPEG